MPEKRTYFLTIIFLITVIFLFIPFGYGYEGISIYYVRYDVKSSSNKIARDNLVFVPSDNDFRSEKFSQVTVNGAIFASDDSRQEHTDLQIRENAIKKALFEKGLKSVKTKDMDTVVSYEGLIKTPLRIVKTSLSEKDGSTLYEVTLEFAPIAFPDQWETLGKKNKIKMWLRDFFLLFK